MFVCTWGKHGGIVRVEDVWILEETKNMSTWDIWKSEGNGRRLDQLAAFPEWWKYCGITMYPIPIHFDSPLCSP